MNPRPIARNLLTILGACLLLSACQTNQPASTAASASSGHLTIHRAANLGTGLIIWIDGGSKVTLRPADTFNTNLAPGQHTINVIPSPNEENQRKPTRSIFACACPWLRRAAASKPRHPVCRTLRRVINR